MVEEDQTPSNGTLEARSGHSPGSWLTKWRLLLILSVGIVAPLATVAVLPYFTDGSPGPGGAATQASHTPEDLANYCSCLTAGSNPYWGTRQRTKLLEQLEGPRADIHSWFVTARQLLARDYLRFGETEQAVRLLADSLEAEDRDDPNGRHKVDLLEELAVTYLKMGQLDNLSPTGALVCALPLDRSVVYSKSRGSTKAIEHLLQLLEVDPGNIKARWLLNIAHMTLGSYPDQVAEIYQVPPDVLESDYEIGRFEDIAPSVGFDAVTMAGGSIIEDFDNDGLLDIMTSTSDPCASITYYHNDGNWRFSDYTSRAGLDGHLGGLNIIQADYNDDGWMDVLVMRGGWMSEDGRMRVSLLRNSGDNTFTDVTHEAGLADPAYPSQTAAWADYDNDGDLDLYACNESEREDESLDTGTRFASQLFRNNGEGAFTDVAWQAGVTNFGYCKGAVWGDYDNDGDPDLYVSNLGDKNRLYRNNGDGTFADVAVELGVVEPIESFATWFWDYDNDGWLDLFVTGYGGDIGDVAADYLRLPNFGVQPRLYRNDGTGGFIDVTREAGLYRVHLPMGANFGDLDNDGFLDFYLGTGYPSFEAVGPNVMYRNNGGKDFVDVTFSGGFGHLQQGHGVAFGDLDRDGDQDIFVQMGGFYPGDGFFDALYENPGHGNHWVSVRLVGEKSNRAAIGARIKLELALEQGTRTVYARVSSGGSFGASTLEQEIGLGQAQRIISMEVYWPTSGILQVFDEVPLDTRFEVREEDNDYRILDPP